ncbi:MAG: hypothetical protein OXG91_02130 [bacterium]|nr:hypothetical protein [bacterium]
MGARSRQPRDEEQFALETIGAVESVVSHRWLPEDREPTPDLELKLSDGRTVAVEITMSTDGAARRLYDSFDGEQWPRAELACEWWVVLADHSGEARERRRNIKALLDHLVPVFQNLEAQDLEADEMLGKPLREFAGSAWPDWNSVYVAKCDPSGGDTGGGIRTWVAVVDAGWAEAVDELVEAVQERIKSKTERGQLRGYPSPRWLVIVMDSRPAAWQLEEVFAPGDQPWRSAAIDAIRFQGLDEVWVVGECAAQSTRRSLLRLFASGAPCEWRTVEIRTDLISAR